MNTNLKTLLKEIAEDGKVDAKEVVSLRKRLYSDGMIDREEADFLFALNDAVSGGENAPGWQKLFVQALADHVLGDDSSTGEVNDKEAAYLIGKIKGNGLVDANELALLVNLTAKAGATPPKFQRFVMACLKDAIVADGVIDADEVKMIRTVVYGGGGGEGASVSRAEADFLFELNDAVSGQKNAPGWKKLFVEAISKHILEDEASPGVVDNAEVKYLMSRIGADGHVDDTEKALIANIRKRAKSVSSKLTL